MRSLKQRFATLDAMRGVAAIAVVIYHIQALYGSTCIGTGACKVRFGYLAVDMFFALSGFVLSYSYHRKFANGLTFGSFLKLRVIRLAPIYWMGAGIGAITVFDGLHHGARILPAAEVLVFNTLLLPSPTFDTSVQTFPLVAPAWSLFLELWVANVIFAMFGSRLNSRALAALISAGTVGLIVAVASYGNLNIGAGWDSFWGGFPRVIYSFFAGVAVQRIHEVHPARRVPAILILALLVASLTLRVPAYVSPFYELTCVLLLYPLLIYVGASAFERSPQIGKMLGDASYAIYVIHLPMLLIALRLMAKYRVQPSYEITSIFVGLVVAVGLMIDSIYDRRARAFLGRLLMRHSIRTRPAAS